MPTILWNDEVADRKRIGGFMFLKSALTTTKAEAEKEKRFWLKSGKRVHINGRRGHYKVWRSLHHSSNLEKYPDYYQRKSRRK